MSKRLELYVIKNGANPLIGRDWIQELQLVLRVPTADLHQVNKASAAGAAGAWAGAAARAKVTGAPPEQLIGADSHMVQTLYDEFSNVFTDQLGCYK